VRRAATAVSERFASETLVLDPENDQYVRLNEAGAGLWQVLERPAQVQELSDALAREWGISAEQADRDVAAFLDSLAERGLVELTPP
jgi:Coenzyme PQQ synthesis protein D (PqqD)